MSDKEIFGDERARRVSHLAANWGRPKSACVCGHTGDGPKSEHGGAIAAGHGRCLVAHCGCSQFTWQQLHHRIPDGPRPAGSTMIPIVRTCLESGKRRHPNRMAAQAALVGARGQYRYAVRLGVARNGPPVRVYQCPHCDGWHLTHKPRGGVG